jgi:tetratricopeptide (TPR) repeat protein
MWNRVLLLALLLFALFSPAVAKNDTWLQITSPHFVVVTNSGEKQGRRIADQFERMRSLFHTMFPKVQMKSSGAPIIVLAIQGEKGFRALEPQEYLAKGSLRLGGLFLQVPDKNYVLMQIDAEGEHPYSVIYHEYTHYLLRKSAEWMPLWMNEGFAEFYQNTDIHEKEASLGQPSPENISWLRQNPLLPLPTLLMVDHNSPYYHEENKGSIFYAESWALVHYIEISDLQQKTHRMVDYSNLLVQKVDPVTAATQAFGDLKKLQTDLNNYVQQVAFHYLKVPTTTEVDDSAFTSQTLTSAQSDSVRADFLAYNSRTSDAQALLDQVLQEDPKNVLAHETKGYLEFRQGHLEEAKKWYAQAVQLDSQSFLAHYYFAAMAMSSTSSTEEQAQIENSLRAAIKLNPSFTPAMDRLAVYLASRQRNLEEAHTLELNAITLEPANVGYRVNAANILMEMQQGQRAVEVLHAAAKIAKTPAESQAVDNTLMHAQDYVEMQTKVAAQKDAWEKASTVTTTETISNASVPQLKHREFVAKGPHHFLVGVLKSVRCDNPALDLTVSTKDKQLTVHGDNYYQIPFSTLGFQASGDLNPCKDLENRPAKVEYVESADPSVTPQLISIELHK